MITYRLEFHVNPDGTGAFLDPDVGGEPTITISNVGNSSIVVPTTLMTRLSQGVFQYVQTNDIQGQSYLPSYAVTLRGIAESWPGRVRISGEDSWYYSNRAGVASILDADTIAVTWDMDDANGEDAGLMVQDGLKSDGYINTFLASEGISVPVVLTGTGAAAAHIVSALADASDHMTIWYGWHRRGLQEMSRALNLSPDSIAGMMSGYKAYADAQLERIADVLLGASNGTPAATGAMTVIVGNPRQYPGTGCVRPVTVDLSSGVGSL
jgi:hypothetical protein